MVGGGTGEFTRCTTKAGENSKNVTVTYVNLHLSVKAIVEQEVVGHADSVGFHRMALAVVIIPNVPCNKIKQKLKLLDKKRRRGRLTCTSEGIFDGMFSPRKLPRVPKKLRKSLPHDETITNSIYQSNAFKTIVH